MIWRLFMRLIRWVRPGWFLPVMFAVYCVWEAMYARLLWRTPRGNPYDAQVIGMVRDLSMLAFVYAFGVRRARSYHPLLWTEYGQWLARTPWRFPKPLPLGAIHLTLADVVFVFIVVLLLHDPYFNLLRVPLLFLFGNLQILCGTMWRKETAWYAYAVTFGLGLVIRLWMLPWEALAAAVVTYAVAYFGLRRTLTLFPWSKAGMISPRKPKTEVTLSTDVWKLAMSKDIGATMIPKQPNSLGWPWDLLRPKQPSMAIGLRDGTVISLLLGWWVYAIAANPVGPHMRDSLLILVLFIIPLAFSIVRISRYCHNYVSPISGWGRLFTLRWIIPGYDKVLVAPLLVFAVPFVAVYGLILGAGLDRLLVTPISVVIASMITLNMGPKIKNWRHTGNHRIVPKYDSKTHLQL